MKNLIFLGALIAAGYFGYKQFGSYQNGKLSDKASVHLAQSLCKHNLMKPVVDAYPQSSMSREDLGKQTIKEGLDRLALFSEKLPAILSPVIPTLLTNWESWQHIVKLGKAGAIEFRKPKWDKNFVEEYNGFVKATVLTMRKVCPDSFIPARYGDYAEFAVGAIVTNVATSQP